MPFYPLGEAEKGLFTRGPYKPLPSQAAEPTSAGIATDFPFIPPPDYKEQELIIPGMSPEDMAGLDDWQSIDNDLPFIPQPDFPADDDDHTRPRQVSVLEPITKSSTEFTVHGRPEALQRSTFASAVHNRPQLVYDPVATASLARAHTTYQQLPDPDALNAWSYLQTAGIDVSRDVPARARRRTLYDIPLNGYSDAVASPPEIIRGNPSRPPPYRPTTTYAPPNDTYTDRERYRKIKRLFETSDEPPVRVLPIAQRREEPRHTPNRELNAGLSSNTLMAHLEEHKRSDSLKHGIARLENCPVCVAAATADILLDTSTNMPTNGITPMGKVSEGDELKRHRQSDFFYQLRSSRSYTAKVTEDRVARTKQELTVTKGEYLEVLDSSDHWWQAANVSGQAGYVPYDILRVVVWDSASQFNNNPGITRQQRFFGTEVRP